jgi:hypothetical protein
MRRRSIWCTIWILSALLVMASLDTTPDPPAVDPHTVTVKVPGPSERAESLGGPTGNGITVNLLGQFQTQGTVFIEEIQPDGPNDAIAETGQAADPSPPAALVGPRHS